MGKKKFEYRSNFPKDESIAYLYLCSPEKKIVAKIYFGNRLSLSKLQNQFSENEEVVKRIIKYREIFNDNYAIPIFKIEFIEPIILEAIRHEINEFMPPRSYVYLQEDSKLSKFLLKNTKVIGNIYLDQSHFNTDELCIN